MSSPVPPSEQTGSIDEERLSKLAIRMAEKALASDHRPSGFWAWMTTQNVILIILGFISVTLTLVLCLMLSVVALNYKNWADVEPMARFTSGFLATIVAYLVGNYVGSHASRGVSRRKASADAS